MVCTTEELFGKYMELQRLMRLRHMKKGPMHDPFHGQGRVLAALKKTGPITAKELGYILGIRQQSLNELINKLEKNGLIVRSQAEEDRRSILIELTEEGNNASQSPRAEVGKMFDVLSDAEKESFSASLDKVISSLKEELGGEEEILKAEEHRRMRRMHGPEGPRPEGCRRGPGRHRRGEEMPGDEGFEDMPDPRHRRHPEFEGEDAPSFDEFPPEDED